MWQISWMLSLLPEWFWWSVLILGLIALALSWFPVPAQFKFPLKIGGLAGIFLGTYMVGMAANEAKWQAKIKELQEQLEIAKNQSKEEVVRIEEKIVYKDRIIKEKGQTQIQYIDRVIKEKEEIKVFIENCPIPKDIVDEHNKAAINQLNEAAKPPKGEKK
jgi:hypothetical protein